MAGDDISKYERDKIEKQCLVLKIIADYCTSDSEHEDIRIIADAIGSGRARLGIDNLSGGYTNYTYKVYLESKVVCGDVPKVALFVKLCFPRAFWNPDPNYVYDLQRIENEAIMMQKFDELAPGCVAVPYLLIDIGGMKLLASQWSPADEQLGNQCNDGRMDIRVAKNLAVAVAALHNSSLDKDFNTEARDCMINLFPSMKNELLLLIQKAGNNRAGKIAKSFGPELCEEMFRRVEESYRTTQIPCHTDLHFFNVLVEAKPDPHNLERFGPDGSICVCDWEMACMGPLGVDIGRIYSIPVACTIAHALSGSGDVADGMIQFLDVYWEEYSNEMLAFGKNEEFLKASYRNAMAWLGWKLFAMSIFEWFIPFFPLEPCNIDKFKESMGVLGLQLMHYGFIEKEREREQNFISLRLTIQGELETIKFSRKASAGKSRRRSSVLRESNRRVSDAFQSLTGRDSLKDALPELDIKE